MILKSEMRVKWALPPIRSCVGAFQNAQDHHLGRKFTRDLPARGCSRMYRPAHPRWHNMTRTLAHICELSSASKAASRSTLSPVTDPACLQLTESMSPSCIRSQPPPNVRTTTKDRAAHKSAAHLCSRCPWRAQRLQRTAVVRPDRARQLVRAPSAGSPARSPRQLKRSWAAPGGSRPSREISESILSTVRRPARPARRS